LSAAGPLEGHLSARRAHFFDEHGDFVTETERATIALPNQTQAKLIECVVVIAKRTHGNEAFNIGVANLGEGTKLSDTRDDRFVLLALQWLGDQAAIVIFHFARAAFGALLALTQPQASISHVLGRIFSIRAEATMDEQVRETPDGRSEVQIVRFGERKVT
jgi:hypothetical protein